MRTIEILDSTLRDGEQAPGYSMSLNEKLAVARQLELLKVDTIEAGFAVSSPADFASIKAISNEIHDCGIASLARALPGDIDYAWDAIKDSKRPLIHIFVATSDIHLNYKLKMSRDNVIDLIAKSVEYARNICPNVEFSAEDATRSDKEYLLKALQTALNCGAQIINIADTVGYIAPNEMYELVKYLKANLVSNHPYKFSVHCHNDLGLAVSNTLAAITAGADRFEGTLCGIGERAGNASVEETAMNLFIRKDYYDACTGLELTRITPACKRLSMITGYGIPANKPIVGGNAFAHESGIHQHGVMMNKSTYEIIDPEAVGNTENKIVLGKHSGRHAFEEKLISLGYVALSKEQIDSVFEQFKSLTAVKHTVNDKEIDAIVKGALFNSPETYSLDKYIINSGNVMNNTCNIRLKENGNNYIDGFSVGSGPIDAAFNAINDAIKTDVLLDDYRIESVTGGADAQGAVSVKIKKDNKTYKGYGVNFNIFEASISAYLNAVNNMLNEEKNKK